MGEPKLTIVKDEKPKNKVEIPSIEEFKQYAYAKIKKKGDDPLLYTDWLEDKYEAWEEAGWKKEKGGKFVEIKMWKTTLLQCLAYRQKNKSTKEVQRVKPLNYNTGKLMEIDNETLVSAWNHWKVMSLLQPKHEECFDILYKRGVFKKGSEPMPNGNPWQNFYDKMDKKSRVFALGWAMDNKLPQKERNEIRRGEHKLCETYIKLFSVVYFFTKFETESQLRKALKMH